MSAHGKTHTPSFVTEKVLAAVTAIPTEEFSISDVHARVKELARHQIRGCLADQARQKKLDRAGLGRYRKGGTRIQTKLSLGLLVEAVWATLFTNPGKRPMCLAEIAGEVETYIGRPVYRARASVAATLTRWYRNGHLNRLGEYHEYTYTIKAGLKDRPISKR